MSSAHASPPGRFEFLTRQRQRCLAQVVAALLLLSPPLVAGQGAPELRITPQRGALLADGERFVLFAEATVEPRAKAFAVAFAQVAAMDANGRALRWRTLQGDALAASLLLLSPGMSRLEPGERQVAPGGRAVLWLPELAFPEDAIPASLWVQLGLLEGGRTVAVSATASLAPFTMRRPLRLPVRGEWLAINGPAAGSPHRTAALLDDAGLEIGQRHALDLMALVPGVGEQVLLNTGTGEKNSDYPTFGQTVLAPASGLVVSAVDGREDHAPMAAPPQGGPAGNHVVLRHGADQFSILAHLMKGSLKVREGQFVKEGEPLGRVGNSGHSTAPHLHYQLCDRPDVFRSQGLPALFRQVRVRRLGARWLEAASPLEGDLIESR